MPLSWRLAFYAQHWGQHDTEGRRAMVEVRDIGGSDKPPADANCVVIEKAGDRYVANGFSPRKRSGTFFSPPSFKALEAAISASVDWAGQHDVPIVYVKGIR